MKSRLRILGLLCFVSVGLVQIAGQERASQLWAEIYKSAWAGIYTNDQAARGESVYRANCASCHGAALAGSDFGPPLAGPDFKQDWNCANIADLFETIQYTMPPNRPGALGQQQIAAVLAYILKANGFPGGSPMPASADELRGIRFLASNPAR